MARAVFGGGLSPYITKAQDRPTPYNPLGALSTAIRQPFVEDVIVPGISRIRDEMRISEQEEQIAAQAEAKRAAAAQFLQQAGQAEDRAYAAPLQMVQEMGAAGADAPGLTRPMLRPGDWGEASLPGARGPIDIDIQSAARALEDAHRAFRAGDASQAEMISAIVDDMSVVGVADVAQSILEEGMSAQDALMRAQIEVGQNLRKSGLSREGRSPSAGPQALQPSMRGERLRLLKKEQYDNPLQYAVDLAARRAYDRTAGSKEQKMSAAVAAAQAAQPGSQGAAPEEFSGDPTLMSEANRLREQATALEAEAKGIEATPVYRTFGDHAMAFLDALDSGDVATQMALMESVGGSTDYQPFGKGAVGKAIGKDASMRARKDLLDLKKKYLAAQRREKTGLKLIAARKPAPKAKKTGGGGGYNKRDQERLRILGNLNNNTPLSAKDRVTLKGLGLTSGEISRIKPGSAGRESWTAITRGMGNRAYSRAQNIMRGQATPEEIGDDKARADERAATTLENQARRTDNQAEKKRLEGLAADIRADAATRAREKENRAAVARLETRLAKAEEKRDRQQNILDQGGAMNGAGVWVNVFDPNTPDAELTSEQKKKKASVKARLASSELAVKDIIDAIDKITPATADQ